jgi:uncharacterized protein YqhQ
MIGKKIKVKDNKEKASSDISDQGASCKKTTIGGQALIEGLMMIGPDKKAMAVRKPDGEIVIEELPANRWSGSANIPFVRGSVRLFRQLVSGTRALLKSAEYMEEEPDSKTDGNTGIDAAGSEAGVEAIEQKDKKKGFFDRFFEKHSELMLYGTAVFGILFSVGLFILLPSLLTDLLRQFVFQYEVSGRGDTLVLTLIEGLIRIIIFVGYLVLASKMNDIKRVWMYHGAEHKTIACYEAREELTPENASRHSRFHPRCGTAFMFTVIIISIIVFAFLGWQNRWLNILIRFVLVPVIAGISYEIIRWTGRFDNWLTRAVAAPGLWLQRLTTAEPDLGMLEVAIAAMKAVLPEQENKDEW